MPVLFLGHGNPMNAITENPYRASWRELGARLPRPKAVLCVSAHWLTRGTQVTMAERPRTIHDFGGFPAELYAQQYPAPGSPHFARLTMERAHSAAVTGDETWGFDHGAWCVLSALFPAADVPVYQLSLDVSRPAAAHLELAAELGGLRDQGVLMVASGNVVHNLRQLDFAGGAAPDWAVEFDAWVKRAVESGDGDLLAEYEGQGAAGRLAVPTADHYLPLLYAMGVRRGSDELTWMTESFDLGSVSMRSLMLGRV